jgi:hypothetical protein
MTHPMSDRRLCNMLGVFLALVAFGCRGGSVGFRFELDPHLTIDPLAAVSGLERALSALNSSDRRELGKVPTQLRLGPADQTGAHTQHGLGGFAVVVPVVDGWERLLAHELVHVVLRNAAEQPPFWLEEGLCELVAMGVSGTLEQTAERTHWIVAQGRTDSVEVAWFHEGASVRRFQSQLPSTIAAGSHRAAIEQLGRIPLASVGRGGERWREIAAVERGPQLYYTQAALEVAQLVERSGSAYRASVTALKAAVAAELARGAATESELSAFAADLLGDVLVVREVQRITRRPAGSPAVDKIEVTNTGIDTRRFPLADWTQALRTRLGRELLAPQATEPPHELPTGSDSD